MGQTCYLPTFGNLPSYQTVFLAYNFCFVHSSFIVLPLSFRFKSTLQPMRAIIAIGLLPVGSLKNCTQLCGLALVGLIQVNFQFYRHQHRTMNAA